MQRPLILGLLAIGSLACAGLVTVMRHDSEAAAPRKAQTTFAVETSGPAIDARSQYDLVAAIDAADHDEEGDLDFLYEAVRKDFQGKRYRWTAHYVPQLCGSSDSCNVLAFEHAGRDKDVVQGWTPNIALNDEQHRALATACAERRPCTFAFSGTLAELTLSTEEFTKLRFTDVEVHLDRLR